MHDDPAREAVAALQSALGPRLWAVVLFGSRARGDAREESDWDLLVVADDLPARLFPRQRYLKALLPPSCRAAISLLARTRAEFLARVPSLYLDIALDGRILYDPHGFAAEHLEALRRRIVEYGFVRERTEAGDFWHSDQGAAGSRILLGWGSWPA